MDNLDAPPTYAPPPPPKRPRPKITLQIPDTIVPMTPRGATTGASIYRGSPRFVGIPPGTPGSHISDPHNPYLMHLYHNKASEFMFKQFEGFKDFTMNTAKSGLSAGEKSAFWFYNRLKLLSRKWFTHLFLSLLLCLYSFVGATVFVALEAPSENSYDRNLTETRKIVVTRIRNFYAKNQSLLLDDNFDILPYIESDLQAYETNYTECMKHINNNNTTKKTWTFWNAMFYAGTLYTTIDENQRRINDYYVKTDGHAMPKNIILYVYSIILLMYFINENPLDIVEKKLKNNTFFFKHEY